MAGCALAASCLFMSAERTPYQASLKSAPNPIYVAQIFGSCIDRSNETYGVIGSINIPLADNSAVLLSGFYDTTEGNVRNIGPSGGTNDATNYGGRISYYADLTDRLAVKASIAYEENQRGLRGAIPDGELFPTTEQLIDLVIASDLNPFIPAGFINSDLSTFFPEQNDTVSIDADESSNANQLISILRLDYDFGPFSLISVNGYAKSERFFLNDDDSSEFASITSEGSARNQFGSTELRLQSNGDNRLDWVAGIFGSLSRNDSQFSSVATELLRQSTFIPAPASLFIEPADLALFPDNQLFIINAPPGTVYQSEDFTYEGRAYAIFGDVNFEVTDRLSLLAGARYNYDQFEQRINRLIDPVGLPGVDILGSEDDPGIGPAFVPFEFDVPSDKVVSDAITWRVSAVYELTDRLSPYATISTGYRPGGVQLQNTSLVGLDLLGFDFSQADLSGADMQGLDLSRAVFVGANLSGANLSRTQLPMADFKEADLRDAKFIHANLTRTSFAAACMGAADLSYPQLDAAKFVHADLRHCKFRMAKLTRVSMQSVDLGGANLYGANLCGARFYNIHCHGTRLPNGQQTSHGGDLDLFVNCSPGQRVASQLLVSAAP